MSGFGIIIPDWISTDYRTAAKIPGLLESAPHLFGVPIVFNILAFGIVALLTVVLVIGIRESASLNTGMVVLKLIVLGFFVVVGWNYIHPENWHPFAPNGWAGVQAGAAIVFFAYIGFDAVSTVAEECKNPKRDLPIGIIGSLIICTIIYIVVAAVFTGIIPYNVLVTKLATEQAGAAHDGAAVRQHPAAGQSVRRDRRVRIGRRAHRRAAGLSARASRESSSRWRATDCFRRASRRCIRGFRTPHVTTILTGVAVGVCAMFTSIDEMVDLTNIGTLFAFILVCIGILILRKRDPGRRRAFRTPFVPLVPVLGILSCGYLMLGLPWITWVRFALWLLVGLVIYFAYGMKRSGLRAGATEADLTKLSSSLRIVPVATRCHSSRQRRSHSSQRPRPLDAGPASISSGTAWTSLVLLPGGAG